MHRRSLLQGALANHTVVGGPHQRMRIDGQVHAHALRGHDQDRRRRQSRRRGQAAPILVKVFELKSSGNFETADYFALQDRDRETLSTELVNADQAIMRSGEERVFKREAGLDSRAIGIIAGYRKLEAARWRIVLPLKEPKQTNLYKVWQFSPSEQAVQVAVRKTGIELLPSR
ncbi:type VI secretion lipoprotein, vasD, evfM, tssJ domain-containing protein [Ditylenchus destructor]|uniref:Type VI secretion lipoprotein, vasD, evfM, tssJ domain-containing protein n=1 Tax=Ditylenchus destructor TaxID=166010 RepID=A0AAD4QV85_9BILA|nr:type VI secretion lipoprotein, vasD, evfM, tssJ domain-containing protein [Ditylenchus destructor]